MRFHQLSGYVQPETESALRRPGNAEELFEYLVAVGLGDAGPFIFHRHPHIPVVPRRADGDGGPDGGVVGGVSEEVAQHHAELESIRRHRQRLPSGQQPQLVAGVRFGKLVAGLCQQERKVCRAQVEPQPSVLDARRLKDLLQEVVQLERLPVDALEQLVAVLLGRLRVHGDL